MLDKKQSFNFFFVKIFANEVEELNTPFRKVIVKELRCRIPHNLCLLLRDGKFPFSTIILLNGFND